MYLDYYGLTEPPFDITPNPRFLFYSARHREAYNHLLYGLRERKGFVQLTGEVGAGKTTLANVVWGNVYLYLLNCVYAYGLCIRLSA